MSIDKVLACSGVLGCLCPKCCPERWVTSTPPVPAVPAPADVEEDYRRSRDLAVAHVERMRIVEWLREAGLNPDKIADARYNIDLFKRRALAADIERGKHRGA